MNALFWLFLTDPCDGTHQRRLKWDVGGIESRSSIDFSKDALQLVSFFPLLPVRIHLVL